MEAILPLGFPDNVVVTNAPGMSSDTIAEHCFAVLLSLSRQLRPWAHLQEAGAWSRDEAVMDRMDRLSGRTMIIVGYGAIAREIALRAKAFGMDVGIVSRSAEQGAGVDRLYSRAQMAQALRDADVLVVATSLTPETLGIIGAAEIGYLKRSAIVVNIARGALIDESALTLALQQGAIAGACLDVLTIEPPPADHPLLGMANVVVTPHVASQGSDGRTAFTKLMCRQLDRYLAGAPLLNRVLSV
jgi:glycerate dehydrogenase